MKEDMSIINKVFTSLIIVGALNLLCSLIDFTKILPSPFINHQSHSRILSFLIGVILIATSLGLHKRLKFVYYWIFAILLLGLVYTVYSAYDATSQQNKTPPTTKDKELLLVILILGFTPVYLWMGNIWRKQKWYFFKTITQPDSH